jgi:hypothetical protein
MCKRSVLLARSLFCISDHPRTCLRVQSGQENLTTSVFGGPYPACLAVPAPPKLEPLNEHLPHPLETYMGSGFLKCFIES